MKQIVVPLRKSARDKPLLKLRQRETIQINQIRNEKKNIIIGTKEIPRIIRKYFKNMYTKILENLKEMDSLWIDTTYQNKIKVRETA